MKKIIVRTAKAEDSISKQRPRARPQPLRSSAGSDGPNVPLLVTVIAVLVVLVFVGSAVSAKHSERPRREPTVRVSGSGTDNSRLSGWDELGGKTMAEWMKEHNTDNKELRERQERIRKFRSGRGE